jgi:hypothetical protein
MQKYEVIVADYKVNIVKRWQWSLRNLLLMFLLFGGICALNVLFPQEEAKSIWVFIICFLVIALISVPEFYNREVIEIDLQNAKIKIRDQEEFNRSEVIKIRIAEVNSSGYTYDYLQLVDAYDYARNVFRMEYAMFFSGESETHKLGRLLADVLKVEFVGNRK